jgi:hypothetical protein
VDARIHLKGKNEFNHWVGNGDRRSSERGGGGGRVVIFLF